MAPLAYLYIRLNYILAHIQRIPWTLAQLYPTTVTVLSERAFFWPMWSAEHIDAVYVQNEYDFETSGQLA